MFKCVLANLGDKVMRSDWLVQVISCFFFGWNMFNYVYDNLRYGEKREWLVGLDDSYFV